MFTLIAVCQYLCVSSIDTWAIAPTDSVCCRWRRLRGRRVPLYLGGCGRPAAQQQRAAGQCRQDGTSQRLVTLLHARPPLLLQSAPLCHTVSVQNDILVIASIQTNNHVRQISLTLIESLSALSFSNLNGMHLSNCFSASRELRQHPEERRAGERRLRHRPRSGSAARRRRSALRHRMRVPKTYSYWYIKGTFIHYFFS